MPTVHSITDKTLTLEILNQVLSGNIKIELSQDAKEKIQKCRQYLDDKLKKSTEPIYGINTGFGSLYNKNISYDELEKLQDNLVKSHACGTGPEVPAEIVKLMLFLKVQSLSYGYSGVQVQTVERLADYFNNDILPTIYEMGSLGASGDLAPLAHLCLPLIGFGEVKTDGKTLSGSALNKQFKWDVIHLQAKEGLALLNGTQFMSSYGTWCTLHAHRILKLANRIGALSLDAFDGRIEPFHEHVHIIRPQKGQIKVAA
ncbi:MAG TPA: aromatic amino acid ammonia-lyase, partial [Cyclobacteriaceae bacterium]